MTSNNGNDQKVQNGWEEKAANVLNALMLMAIGLALGASGVWAFWQFATAVAISGFGRDTDWMVLGFAAMFIVGSIQTFRFGAGMHRSKHK